MMYESMRGNQGLLNELDSQNLHNEIKSVKTACESLGHNGMAFRRDLDL